MDGARPAYWVDQSKAACFRLWDILRPHEHKNVRTVERDFQLTQGTHALVLTNRRPGTRLDCLVVNNQPYIPQLPK